jgi:Rrf2 family protein
MFSQTCEYALRAMTYIAQHGEERPVLAREIARRTSVPLKYLQKVLGDLVRQGLLKSSRGIGGGFRLNKPARRLSLAEVLAPFDDLMRRTSCPFGNPLCGEANPCPVHDRWVQVVGPYRDFLQTTMLADLVDGVKEKPGKRVKRKRKVKKKIRRKR